MSGEGVQRDGGYEHAGGYQSVLLWPSGRETAVGVGVGVFIVACKWLLDELLGRGPAKDLFNLAMGAIFLGLGAWMIMRPDRAITEDSVPTSLLYPERLDEDAAAQRRRARIWGAFIVIVALALIALSLDNLLGAGGGR
jgi:hypothetical protein